MGRRFEPVTAATGTPLRRRMVVERLALSVVVFIPMGAALFLGAGRLDWWQAWVYLLAHWATAVVGMLWLARKDPALSHERSRMHADAKAWDKAITVINLVLTPLLLLVVGLDAGRFQWSCVPTFVRLCALLGFLPAFALPTWASSVNTFMSGQVRIQQERGHRVVEQGPYRLVRHPMYLGMGLYDLCLPLVLGSWRGLLITAIMWGVLVVRTALEDRTLRAELPGYLEYAQRVRHRLVPGIW